MDDFNVVSDKEVRKSLDIMQETSHLLALIHGDGGHYQQKHGTLEAIKVARLIIEGRMSA